MSNQRLAQLAKAVTTRTIHEERTASRRDRESLRYSSPSIQTAEPATVVAQSHPLILPTSLPRRPATFRSCALPRTSATLGKSLIEKTATGPKRTFQVLRGRPFAPQVVAPDSSRRRRHRDRAGSTTATRWLSTTAFQSIPNRGSLPEKLKAFVWHREA